MGESESRVILSDTAPWEWIRGGIREDQHEARASGLPLRGGDTTVNTPIRPTREFEHYQGCKFRDPDNCGGCALTHGGEEGPNYTAWPLAYMANGHTIPAKWRKAFLAELARTDNDAYVANIKRHMAECGVRFSDGKPLEG